MFIELNQECISNYEMIASILNIDVDFLIKIHQKSFANNYHKDNYSSAVIDPAYSIPSGCFRITYDDIASVPTVFCGSHPGIIGVNIPF
jgi:hypothetical protein